MIGWETQTTNLQCQLRQLLWEIVHSQTLGRMGTRETVNVFQISLWYTSQHQPPPLLVPRPRWRHNPTRPHADRFLPSRWRCGAQQPASCTPTRQPQKHQLGHQCWPLGTVINRRWEIATLTASPQPYPTRPLLPLGPPTRHSAPGHVWTWTEPVPEELGRRLPLPLQYPRCPLWMTTWPD